MRQHESGKQVRKFAHSDAGSVDVIGGELSAFQRTAGKQHPGSCMGQRPDGLQAKTAAEHTVVSCGAEWYQALSSHA